MKNSKNFYENHRNFCLRTPIEYEISPGIRCKFDFLIREWINLNNPSNVLDLGCSGNSILLKIENIPQKSFVDIAFFPLKQYAHYSKFGKYPSEIGNHYPICADLSFLPYRENSFDLIFALDVLEHIKDDFNAMKEINRILKNEAYLIITVPHGMKYFSAQDKMIGHYRRYEIKDLIIQFRRLNLKKIKIFGIYGRFMKFADIQSSAPRSIENNIVRLRDWYVKFSLFRKIWNVINWFLSWLMRWDAKNTPLKEMRNIAMIFIKNEEVKI